MPTLIGSTMIGAWRKNSLEGHPASVAATAAMSKEIVMVQTTSLSSVDSASVAALSDPHANAKVQIEAAISARKMCDGSMAVRSLVTPHSAIAKVSIQKLMP